jgi:hypothetical protein
VRSVACPLRTGRGCYRAQSFGPPCSARPVGARRCDGTDRRRQISLTPARGDDAAHRTSEEDPGELATAVRMVLQFEGIKRHTGMPHSARGLFGFRAYRRPAWVGNEMHRHNDALAAAFNPPVVSPRSRHSSLDRRRWGSLKFNKKRLNDYHSPAISHQSDRTSHHKFDSLPLQGRWIRDRGSR